MTVGVLVPLTGELGEFGKIVADSIELGAQQINANGGTSCGPIRLVASDTGGSAETGIREATRMIDSEGAVAVLQNEESTISPAQVARQRVTDACMKIKDYIVYNPGQSSYQAELISALANEPDAIYLAGGQESGITVIKEASVGGFRGEWLFTADLAVPEIFDAAGEQLLNCRAFVEFADSDSSLSAFKAFEELHISEKGAEPGPFAANSFDMINLVALALEALEGCTGETKNEHMH